MDVQVQEKENVTVIYLDGKLDGNAAPLVQEKIMTHVLAGCRLVIDLSKCDYISSAGLRILLMIAKQLAREGGKWGLSSASPEIIDVMDMTGFNSLFTHYDTVADAVSAFKKEA